MQISIMIK